MKLRGGVHDLVVVVSVACGLLISSLDANDPKDFCLTHSAASYCSILGVYMDLKAVSCGLAVCYSAFQNLVVTRLRCPKPGDQACFNTLIGPTMEIVQPLMYQQFHDITKSFPESLQIGQREDLARGNAESLATAWVYDYCKLAAQTPEIQEKFEWLGVKGLIKCNIKKYLKNVGCDCKTGTPTIVEFKDCGK